MTAIAGFWNLGNYTDPRQACRRMLDRLASYGPDDSACSQLDDLGLGRNLFRLLPEDEQDRQPIVNPAGRFALVADARLDNREALADALDLDGAAAGLADADLLFRALMRWGEQAAGRLEGDFAFAFFDARERRLVLGRDFLGQRPLFWHRGAGFLAFASMPKGIHAVEGAPAGPDLSTVARYLSCLPQFGPASFHEGIERVEPGHIVVFTPGSVERRRYWNPPRRELRLARLDDYVDAFRAELDQAVARRLRGAGETVAAHLSGGWDSSAVAATAARLTAERGGRVLAFTAVPRRGAATEGPAGRFVDEGPLAACTAARHANIEHRLIELPERSPLTQLDRDIDMFERPPFNPCNQVWLAEIRTAARAGGARVLLTGETGNWSISASPSTLLADYLRQGRWLAWGREALAIAADRRARWRGILANSFGPWLPNPMWNRLRPLSSAPELGLQTSVHPRLRAAMHDEQEARRLGLASRPKDNFERTVNALLRMDGGEYRKGILGGWGLDKRDVAADRRLIEFCLSLPIDMLLSRGVRRPLARAALADRLPPEVLDERRKGYQGAGWHVGLTGDRDRARELVGAIAADAAASSVIDVDLLRALVRDWPDQGWEQTDVRARYRTALLQALAAGRFVLAGSR